jgi:hypothetical protein
LVAAWLGIAWLLKAVALRRKSPRREDHHVVEAAADGERRPNR